MNTECKISNFQITNSIPVLNLSSFLKQLAKTELFA